MCCSRSSNSSSNCEYSNSIPQRERARQFAKKKTRYRSDSPGEIIAAAGRHCRKKSPSRKAVPRRDDDSRAISFEYANAYICAAPELLAEALVMTKVVCFPPQMRLLVDPLPTAEQAFVASCEYVYLQQIFPMLRTIEEQENNLQKTQQAMSVMQIFIASSYRSSTRSTTN